MYLRVNHTGKGVLPLGWHWAPRFRDIDLWIAWGGRGIVQTPQGDLPFQRGDCFLLPPGTGYFFSDVWYGGNRRSQIPLLHSYIHFDYVNQRGVVIPPTRVKCPPVHRRLRNLVFIENLLDRIREAAQRDEDAAQEDAAMWLRAVLVEIQAQDNAPRLSGIAKEHAERIEKICQNILKHPEDAYSLTELAQSCYYSREHFARVFKQIRGVSPGVFIVNARIERAKMLLHTSSLSITQIAASLGYQEIYFFSRQFRAKTGFSPSQYRRMCG